MSIHFKHTSSQPFSIPTNSSRQYHNRQNYHSIRLIFDSIQFDSIRFDSIQFDSIRFNSNHSNPFSPHVLKSVEIDYPQTFQQFPHSAVLIVAALRTIQTIQTIEVAAVRVPSSSLSIVAPLNTKFPSFGSNVSHSVSNPTLRGRISSVVRHSCPSVNQWPFYHPDHFLGNTLSSIDFEFSVSSFESLLSTNTLLLRPSPMLVSTFHHDSVCSWQLWLPRSLHTTQFSLSLYSSCPPNTLFQSLLPTLFFVLLSTLRKYLHNLIHFTLSILLYLVRYLWRRGKHYRRWKT